MREGPSFRQKQASSRALSQENHSGLSCKNEVFGRGARGKPPFKRGPPLIASFFRLQLRHLLGDLGGKVILPFFDALAPLEANEAHHIHLSVGSLGHLSH